MAVNPTSWSTTANSNTTLDGISTAENVMVVSAVNNAIRSLMAGVKEGLDALSGAKTTAGSSGAYTLTSGYSLSAYAAGQAFFVKANHTNSGAATLNIDSLGAKDITDQAGTALAAGAITSGGYYWLVYSAGADDFILATPYIAAATAAAAITDNRVVRGDGGARGLQESPIVIDDTTGSTYPSTNDSGSLGKSGNAWADLFLASGGVLNWNASNYTITHSSGDLAFSGSVTLTNTGLHLLDTNASHDLIVKPGSDITADRTLTIATGDADRTVTIAGDGTLAYVDAEDQTITGGARVTIKDLGTVSSGTTTPDPGDRPMQKLTNGGAFTLAPGSNNGSYLLDITNNGSAGTITTSGWTKVTGTFTTTNGHKFRCHCSVGDAGSLLSIQALQ